MTADRDADLPHDRDLINPYQVEGVSVRGVTLGRIGLAAAGVVVVAAGPVDAGSSVAFAADTQVWLGSGPAVAAEMGQQSAPAGYLWPAPPPEPLASPALSALSPPVTPDGPDPRP
ncbi:MAG TPA: hypothetical protein VD813_00730 [Pseudonocardia sp.]|nr:hypothetical protein [Pseudonocardia sp.]